MKFPLLNQGGEKIGEVDINPKIFKVNAQPELVSQAVVTQLAGRRQNIAHAKIRSDVAGGGAKPWRQKGTGRARHGSIRSPLWKGGGVTFGPTRLRNFTKRINKKAKRKALFSALSDHAEKKKLVIVDKIELSKIKTKDAVNILAKLKLKNKKTLIILPQTDTLITKSINNLPYVKTICADSLNVVDVLNHEFLLIAQNSLKKMEETFLK